MVTKLLMILAVLVVLFTAGIAPTPARASGIRVVLGAPIHHHYRHHHHWRHHHR